MTESFPYDVFLSHSSKDKAVVRPLAERLRTDGLKVWFDEWVLKPGDSIPAKIEEGLEHSRVLVLCMSANAFGSDWTQMEAGTFRFRDPLNKERRFIPLRLDDTPIKGPLAQFHYINWLPSEREHEYSKLLETCRPLPNPEASSISQTEVPRLVARASAQEARKSGITIDDANIGIAVSQAVGYQSSQRPTVWVIGSYNELEAQQVILVRKMVATLGSGLAARGVRLVSGKSDMLDELAANCRNVAMSMNPRGPLPIMLDGKLRQTDLKILFQDTIGRIPNLAIVVGGGVSRRRAAEECVAAEEAGIPVLPVPATGGTAAQVKLTALKANDLYKVLTKGADAVDTNDLVAAVLKAVERYAPNAGEESAPWCRLSPGPFTGNLSSPSDEPTKPRQDFDALVRSAKDETRTRSFQEWAGAERVMLAIVFTDVVGSTALAEKLKEKKWAEVRRAHFAQCRKLIGHFKGREIKTIGDSFMAAFKAADAALDFALALQGDTGDPQVKIRAGIHIGAMLVEECDVFGGTVNFAARVVAAIKGAEIWLSQPAKSDIDQLGAEQHEHLIWEQHDGMEMKGFAGKFTLWSLASDKTSPEPTPLR
jgi:class 3 adenylate cyclase